MALLAEWLRARHADGHLHGVGGVTLAPRLRRQDDNQDDKPEDDGREAQVPDLVAVAAPVLLRLLLEAFDLQLSHPAIEYYFPDNDGKFYDEAQKQCELEDHRCLLKTCERSWVVRIIEHLYEEYREYVEYQLECVA